MVFQKLQVSTAHLTKQWREHRRDDIETEQKTTFFWASNKRINAFIAFGGVVIESPDWT